MRILILDPQGSCLDWAMRCQQHGHEVKMYIRSNKDGSRSNIGDGLIEKVEDYKAWAKWPDLVFLPDNTHFLRDSDQWRENGIPVVGATQESAEWEMDRAKGQEAFTRHGIPTLDGEEFSDYDTAIAYVKKQDERFVSKPTGDKDPSKGLSYVSKSPEDMVYMLERWKKNATYKSPFILQRFVPGIEMAVGGWIGPTGFLPGWCENFEFKKLMDGDKGPNTGEQGTVLRYVKNSKLADKVLAPLETELSALGHTGYVDVNCIVDDKGTPWPLEWTMRPGWPTFNVQEPLHKGDPATWLINLAQGDISRDSPFLMNILSVGVVMTIPDYPYSHLTKKEVTGIPVYGISGRNAENIHPCEMMMGEAPQRVGGAIRSAPTMVTAGDYILVATGTGATVRAAKSRAYRVMESLTVPNSPMWRTDIGQRLISQLPKLQSHGYASGIEY